MAAPEATMSVKHEESSAHSHGKPTWTNKRGSSDYGLTSPTLSIFTEVPNEFEYRARDISSKSDPGAEATEIDLTYGATPAPKKMRRHDPLRSSLAEGDPKSSRISDSGEVKKLQQLVSQLQNILQEYPQASGNRAELEAQRDEVIRETGPLTTELRILELQAINLRSILDHHEDTLFDIDTALDRVEIDEVNRSGKERRLRQEIKALAKTINIAWKEEQQIMEDVLASISHD
ncbi:MAG: hypothetical protein Q9204_001815 [Flavoplaca sp. TL-2023a]